MLGPSHEGAEIVLNLWAYSDEEGYIRRLAGKCYALHGNDAEKLAVLRSLAKSDYLSAHWEPVPDNYGVVYPGGRELLGVATTNEVMDFHASVRLFGGLIDRMEASLPQQFVSKGREYSVLQPKIPEDPLRIVTVVIEQSDGRLIPVLNPSR